MSSLGATIEPGRPAGRFDGFSRAALKLGIREVRLSLRNPEVFVPNLVLPVALFFIFVAALSTFARDAGIQNYGGFFLPLAIVFAVVGGSAGLYMASDIESGYFDKLLVTPVSRSALLLGPMGADLVRIFVQGLLTASIAMATGTEIATGVLGAVVMVLISSLFGLAFEALGFAIALRTGNPAASRSLAEFMFPLFLLTTSFAPIEAMSGWLATAARLNPLTYVFGGLRALTLSGWDADEIMLAVATAGLLVAVALALALRALRAHVR